MSLGWDLLMFFAGFATGALVAVSAILFARLRRESLREGDRFLAKLGAVGAEHFLEVVQE
jgi:hypothetical protein